MFSVTRSRSIVRNCALALIALGGAASTSVAYGQASLADFSAQTLDRVDIIYPTDADNVAIDTTIRGQALGRQRLRHGGNVLYAVPEHGDSRHVLPRRQRRPPFPQSQEDHRPDAR